MPRTPKKRKDVAATAAAAADAQLAAIVAEEEAEIHAPASDSLSPPPTRVEPTDVPAIAEGPAITVVPPSPPMNETVGVVVGKSPRAEPPPKTDAPPFRLPPASPVAEVATARGRAHVSLTSPCEKVVVAWPDPRDL
jgi:hypothetical protein